MQLLNCLKLHLDPRFADDKDASAAFDEFIKNIPGRILQHEVDETKTGKQGIIKDNSVYKFGTLLESNMFFLEFFADRNQGMPTMGIYADKNTPALTVKGSKVEKQYVLSFKIENGKVKKLSRLVT